MKNAIYFISPKNIEVGSKNSLHKKPLKRCPTVKAMTKKCKSTALRDTILKVHDTKTFYLSKKREKATLPISPLLTKQKNEIVSRESRG